MINSLAGFVITATIGISAIIGSLIGMSWVERRLLGPAPPPVAARGQERVSGRLVVEYRSKRAELARGSAHRLPALLESSAAAGHALVEIIRNGTVRPPEAPAGGPGAMRRPDR
ncbi:hypothetical protein IQ251_02185 [Saccharopolyspora sp. HNM0983]|uniref:Uncharacterized protein n=1 Tax=Saccharopolyspora montiporae TaxID=2781240 RepID=A0A929B4Z1_9PSEU|nr:hypothetical protein [Saccharopolyspora sp. HNM0983]MBE9373249.1 hypothetical protein [Saccharopolyspora sp. HNM0983]